MMNWPFEFYLDPEPEGGRPSRLPPKRDRRRGNRPRRRTHDQRRIQGRRPSRRPHRFSADVDRRLKQLSATDNWHGPLALIEDSVIFTLAILLYLFNRSLLPASAVLIGTRQRGLATLLHEASHYTLCRWRWLNVAIGSIAGWLIFQTFIRYWQTHVKAHHPFLGDENLDPDIKNYLDQGLFEHNGKSFVLVHVIPLILGLKSVRNLASLIRDRLLPAGLSTMSAAGAIEYVGFVGFWTLLITAAISFGFWQELLLLWLLPYLTVFQTVNWAIEVAEHFPLTRLFDTELEMTRNRRGPPLENFFTGIHGESWHLVHHLRPGIPFWNVAKAHQVMMADPQYAAANAVNGGLFMRGPMKEPSILSLLNEQLRKISAADEMN